MSSRQRHQLTFTSEFATDIAHVPGLDNVVADTFSQQYDNEPEAVAVHSVAHMLSGMDLSDLARDQRPIRDEPASSLELRLVSFPGVDNPMVCDTSLGRPRVLVPDGRQCSIFEAIHGLAHPSGKATLSIITRLYVWRGMRRDALRWAGQCETCATSKIERHTNPPVMLIPAPSERFSQVHVDIVGPFSPDEGFRYLLTMVYRTTRWPEAAPLADTTADTVLQAFLGNWVARFGIPNTVVTDRGAHFTSETWRKALAQLGVKVTTTTAYHPQTNGIVERFHRTLKAALRCAVKASQWWMRLLPWVMLGLRNAPKLDTSTSTAEVVYGTPPRIPGMCFQVG